MSFRTVAIVLAAALVAGCAGSSKVMLGQARAPIDPAQVQIYRTPPAGSQEIAQLESKSAVGFGTQGQTDAAVARINGSRVKMASVERRLKLCAALCPTWVQTCLFALDGQLPTDAELAVLADFLGRCRDSIRGVHLYGLARPSAQPEAPRLSAAPVAWLEGVAVLLKQKGLTVEVSP
jgi:hypothetical protein